MTSWGLDRRWSPLTLPRSRASDSPATHRHAWATLATFTAARAAPVQTLPQVRNHGRREIQLTINSIRHQQSSRSKSVSSVYRVMANNGCLATAPDLPSGSCRSHYGARCNHLCATARQPVHIELGAVQMRIIRCCITTIKITILTTNGKSPVPANNSITQLSA